MVKPHASAGRSRFGHARQAPRGIASLSGLLRDLSPACLLGSLALCLLCAAGIAAAQSPYQPGYQPWQFRPMPPSNARGVPPGAPAPPAESTASQPPGSVAPSAGAAGTPPATSPTAPPGFQQPYPAGYPSAQGARSWPGQAPPGRMPAQQPGQYAAPYPPGQGQPGAYSAYGRQGLSPAAAPRIELVLDERNPYVQQNMVLRLRVVSSGNLATASPQVDGVRDVLFEQIEGPLTSTRTGAGGPEIVNEYVLAMTPLREGLLDVGPLRVTGTLAAGVPFEAVARQTLELDVRPAIATVRPWLALRSLHIDAELAESGDMARGRPVSLSIELTAEGAVGGQLPSLESQLRSDDFRVYREQTLTDTRLAENGRTLIGKRIEVYTLVPQSGGRLQLPELRLGWWNVETASREASSVPIRMYQVAGESGPFGFAESSRTSEPGEWRGYWLPVAGIGLLLIGYWGGVWLRAKAYPGERRPLLALLRDALRAAGKGLVSGLGWLGRTLNPMPALRWLGRKLNGLAPASTRVYQCAAAAESAADPADWCLAFQQHACRRLSTSAREPLPRMADRITALRPGADGEAVQRLMRELDRALYNGDDIDFPRWKRDFRRALRPGLGVARSLLAGRVRRARLPELNPRAAA